MIFNHSVDDYHPPTGRLSAVDFCFSKAVLLLSYRLSENATLH
jgi:hypothetical protein